jgi:hypothetical protein
MLDLDPLHHIFRYVGGGSIEGDFIDPAAFRRKVKDGKLEEGLSVNWVEYFEKATPKEAIAPLRETFVKKKSALLPNLRFSTWVPPRPPPPDIPACRSYSMHRKTTGRIPSSKTTTKPLTTRFPRSSRKSSSIHFLPNILKFSNHQNNDPSFPPCRCRANMAEP